ncbi:hypothetical protein ACOSQ2_012690 [Xanthoceras sorbifolium]
MATTVVCLRNALTPPPCPRFTSRRRRSSPNPNFNRSRLRSKQQLTEDTFPNRNKPEWGNVRILKRGELLLPGSLIAKETILEQKTVNESFFFSGSGISASPSPRSLPLPSFLGKKITV